MKQTLQKSFLALLAVVFLFGCSHQDAVLDAPVPGQEKISLVYGDAKANLASSFSEPLSKGQVFSTGAFAWVNGDSISVWYSGVDRYEPYVVENDMVTPSTSLGDRANYAIYPSTSAPAATSAYSGTTPYVKYPETYAITGNEFDSRMPLIAKNTEGDYKLIFYHVGGLLRLKLKGVPSSTRSIGVQFEKSELTGTFAVDVTTDPNNPVTKRADGENAVDNGCTLRFNFLESVSVPPIISYLNIPLPVGNYDSESITVTLYDEDDNIISKPGGGSFTSTIELGNISRRTGRLYATYLFGITEDILGVSIGCSSPENFLNTSVTPHRGTLYLYDAPYEAQLTATVNYRNSGSITDNSLVNWSTSDATKVRVSATGRITAVGLTDDAGVTITATSVDDASVSASVTIRVLAYSPVSNFTPTPFSVAADRTVEFSPGNLQATIKTDNSSENAEWQFAQYQYDYIGAHEGSSINTTVGRTIDLFYWSGVESSIDHYGFFNPNSKAFTEFVDWGNNKISYRGNHYADEYTYRTLTAPEWKYLLDERTGSKAGTVGSAKDCRFSMVTVENVFGMIIYPDNFYWVPADMGPMPTRVNVYSTSCGSYSGEQWVAIESAGVVFLPAAGYRPTTSNSYNNVLSAGSVGCYHSSTPGVPQNGKFNSGIVYDSWEGPLFSSTYYAACNRIGETQTGRSVRLVKINDGEKTNVRKIEVETTSNRAIQIETTSFPAVRAITSTVYYQDGPETNVALQVHIAPNAISETDYTIGYYTEQRPITKSIGSLYENLDFFEVVDINKLKATSGGYVAIYVDGTCYDESIRSRVYLVGATDGYIHRWDNGKKIVFAPGNLQAFVDAGGNPGQWRFAEHQYESIIHTVNTTAVVQDPKSIHFEGWTEVFGASNGTNNYGAYAYSKLSPPSLSFVDWGDNLSITHGGTTYPPGTWRTPDDYDIGSIKVTNYRGIGIDNNGNLNKSSRNYVKIGDRYCLLLLPDGYILPSNFTFCPNIEITQISPTEWQNNYESKGWILLPQQVPASVREKVDIESVTDYDDYGEMKKNTYTFAGFYYDMIVAPSVFYMYIYKADNSLRGYTGGFGGYIYDNRLDVEGFYLDSHDYAFYDFYNNTNYDWRDAGGYNPHYYERYIGTHTYEGTAACLPVRLIRLED